MKILKLIAENVKRLSVVEITPQGNLVIIGGKNSAGKSSTIDSIMYALAGGDSLPEKPVRRGQQKARIELDLGDIIVKRRFTAAGGTSLTVTNKEGVRFSSPQAMLDSLTGRLSFDPLEFSRQKPDAQAKTLKELLGLDFTKQDQERQRLYDERTAVNREVSQAKAKLATMPTPVENLPAEPTSTADILAEMAKAGAHNGNNQVLRNDAVTASREFKSRVDAVISAEEAITDLRNHIATLQSSLTLKEAGLAALNADKEKAKAKAEEAHAKAEACQDIDLGIFQNKLHEAEWLNGEIAKARTRAEVAKQMRAKESEVAKLSNAIDTIDSAKMEAITSAKMPVPGLGFDELGNVTLEGVPFEQAGTRDQIAVSVAVGLALNKKLPVLLIRRGSEIDEDGLKLIAEMAEKADAQVWLEVVREGDGVSVVIEDGHVKGVEPVDQPEGKEEPELGITP